MTKIELGTKLKIMYDNALQGEKVTMIILFGIQYGKVIRENNYSFKEIAQHAHISEKYGTEINKGANLSKYVQVK
jgi:hypothetical protein